MNRSVNWEVEEILDGFDVDVFILCGFYLTNHLEGLIFEECRGQDGNKIVGMFFM